MRGTIFTEADEYEWRIDDGILWYVTNGQPVEHVVGLVWGVTKEAAEGLVIAHTGIKSKSCKAKMKVGDDIEVRW